MNVLVVNCGSSSLKFQLINSETEAVAAKGLCERIGLDGRLVYQPTGGEKEVTELVTDDDMKQTPKGFGIIETHQINDVDRYRAVILCKTTMAIPAEAATTKGESIEWQTKEIEGTITRSDENTENYKHPWKREAWFDTEKEAMEYLKTVLNVLERVEASSSEGTSVGKTRIIITNRTEGATYKYNTKEQASKYKQDLSKWTEFPEGGEIEAENGTVIYLAKQI